MRTQSQKPTHIFAAFPAALWGGATDGSRDGSPPGVRGNGTSGRFEEDRNLTSVAGPCVYNLPAASGSVCLEPRGGLH